MPPAMQVVGWAVALCCPFVSRVKGSARGDFQG